MFICSILHVMSCPLDLWDHSKQLEQLGGVAIVDPLVEKARDVLEKKMTGPYAHLYTN